MTVQVLANFAKIWKIVGGGKLTAFALAAVITALVSFADDPVVWEGSTNLTMTADTTVEVPAGTTNVIDTLGGAYTLTKIGGGVLEVRYSKSASAKFVVSEGLLRFANPRPDDIFAKAYFHVDASDLSSMTIETVNGTNFVTRWNDTDGRTNRYARHCTTVWNCRTNPENRKPFLRMDFQNGLPVMDFGSLLTRYNTNEVGQALGYGAAMNFDKTTPYVKDGFTVASDTEDYYTWTWSGSGMSFFSHETSYRFTRCGVTGSNTALGIMGDNAQNNDYFANGKSVWLDATLLTSHPKWTAPSPGFHIVRIRPSADGGTTFNSFGAEFFGSNNGGNRSYGGQRIAEYVLFTNKTEEGTSAMTTNEASMVNRYLRVKWFPQTVAAVTVANGASLDVDASANLTITSFRDEGAESLALVSTATNVIGTLVNVGALAHLDASATNTMTIIEENGTNFVTRWNDVDGGSEYAVDENTTGHGGQRTNPEMRKPFLNPTLVQNGLPIIDLGSAIYYSNTNGHGAAFRFANFPNLIVAEYLSVISDTEDLKTRLSGQYGPAYTSYRSKSSSFDGYNPGRRGKTVSGKNPPLFYDVSSSGNAACQNGTNYVNGVNVTWSYNPPDGFNIVNIRPRSAISCNLIGRQVRCAGSNRVDTYGGQRLAEYMIFGSILSDEKRDRIYKALRTKWYGDPIAVTNYYNNLSLGATAEMTVKWDALAVTNRLTLAGSLVVPVLAAANVDVAGTGAAVDGELTLTDGATLSFTRQTDGSWTSLSATSLAAEGAVNVVLSAADQRGLGGSEARILSLATPPAALDGWTVSYEGKYTAELRLREDGVWVEFIKPGVVILVK